MLEVIDSDQSWKQAWSQQERQGSLFAAWCYDVISRLPFRSLDTASIYNCSDGPAALGIIQAIAERNTSIAVAVTDIHPYAVQAAQSYLQEALSKGILPPSVAIDAYLCDTRELLIGPHLQSQNFIAFEPIDVDIELFEAAYDALLPDSSIVVVGRGRLGPVLQLGLAGKHRGATSLVESGIYTDQGEVTAVMIMK